MKDELTQLSDRCEAAANLLKAVAHPIRLKILCRIAAEEATVSEIEEYCGASQSSVSQYLGKMKLERLVTVRRDGRQMFYRIESQELKKLMVAMKRVFCK